MAPSKVNGDAAALKKRKRDKNGEDHKSQKKPKRLSGGQAHSSDPAGPLENGQLELTDDGVLANVVLGKTRAPLWKLSNPMGGRMLDIDPIFSTDELHLIVTYNTSIQVYSTGDSLLVRRISIPISQSPETTGFTGARIISTLLSKTSSHHIWVTSSDGRIWRIDWTTGQGVEQSFSVQTRRVIDITVEAFTIGDTKTEVLFILEKAGRKTGRIVAYDLDALVSQNGKVLHTYEDGPKLLRSALSGRLIVATAAQTVQFGSLTTESRNIKSITDLEFQWVSFEVDDIISCLDLRCPSEGRKQQKGGLQRPVDLALGFARGKIQVFSDILANFPGRDKSVSRKSTRPRKYHWHRRAVHSVKWSLDGNYLLSGGSETVLVQWQLDTEKPDFLPHLSASIENIVVSPQGSSYAIHLDDNSTMVLSTAEMVPTVYVSGIQSEAFDEQYTKDSLVKRVGQNSDGLTTPLTAIQNPADPSQLLLSVGQGQQAASGDGTQSTPLLQIFDLSTFHNLSKQAIARTNPAGVNISSLGYPIVEPRVTQLAFSPDGQWLVSIDEWEPPERDLETIADATRNLTDFRHERREVYLKFWEVGRDENSFPTLRLSSRVNDSHHTNHAETIFDLAADPSSSRFATIGADRTVRFWTSRVRQTDGLVATGQDGHTLTSWACSRVVPLSNLHRYQTDAIEEPVDGPSRGPSSGALTFSEDGSILFAALGGSSNTVYVVDTHSGVIRSRIHDIFRGDIRAIKSLGPCCITMSDDLNVYDLVADELRYGFSLSQTAGVALPLAHLAVNSTSQSFALAVVKKEDGKDKVLRGASSALAVFSLDAQQPQFETIIPHAITSVLAAARSPGFVFVDAAAQVWTVSEGPETATVAQPLADINLDNGVEEPASALALINGEDEVESDEEMADADQDGDIDMEEFETHPSIINTQQLEELYDAAPAWAMPSTEDIFYQVTALLAN